MAKPGNHTGVTIRYYVPWHRVSWTGVTSGCWVCMLVLFDKRCTTEGAIFGSFGVCTLCCLLVFSLCCFLLFCCVATIFLLSWLWLIFLLFLFFSSAAINRRPYDCMRSAGEDGGFERVFIERLTNTNWVAEKRSTAAYTVSYCMARFTYTTCFILPEITRISIHIVRFRGRRVDWVWVCDVGG